MATRRGTKTRSRAGSGNSLRMIADGGQIKYISGEQERVGTLTYSSDGLRQGFYDDRGSQITVASVQKVDTINRVVYLNVDAREVWP